MRGQTIFCTDGNLVTEICYRCNVHFALPETLYQVLLQQREKGSFYCPHGHSQHYVTGESNLDKMRRERDRAKQEQARLADLHAAAEARADKADRALKRHKKRAAAGTCPCCQRTFSALAEHMKKQHPDFVAETGANVVPLKRKA